MDKDPLLALLLWRTKAARYGNCLGDNTKWESIAGSTGRRLIMRTGSMAASPPTFSRRRRRSAAQRGIMTSTGWSATTREMVTAYCSIRAPTRYFRRSRTTCLLYTSDAADERSSVDLGG